MATFTVQDLLHDHSTNPVKTTGMATQSRKAWTQSFPPISNLRVHTVVQPDGSVIGDFDSAFIPLDTDENLRQNEEAHLPNARHYRLYSEEDGVTWFNAEISSVVLAAFQNFPAVVQQSHHPPKRNIGVAINVVDTAYTMKAGPNMANIAIGEFKRNLIRPQYWQNNGLAGDQVDFSRELRGYAYLYECPQVFSFDHEYFLMLQFRAHTVDEIRNSNCEVDCWVFPRENLGGTPWRYALYRLLVQGFRRFQGLNRTNMVFGGLAAESVTLYTGRPRWRIDNRSTLQPFGYTRVLDPNTGAFVWVDATGSVLLQQDGTAAADTIAFWGQD